VTNTKDILKALEVQESQEGVTDNIVRLRRFLGCIDSASQWTAFVVRKDGPRYGPHNYQVHRYYYGREALERLFE